MKVSKSEYGIRFGCGALLGFIVGFFVMRRTEMNLAGPVKNGIAIALLFGILAAIFGDKFWYSRWWRNW